MSEQEYTPTMQDLIEAWIWRQPNSAVPAVTEQLIERAHRSLAAHDAEVARRAAVKALEADRGE